MLSFFSLADAGVQEAADCHCRQREEDQEAGSRDDEDRSELRPVSVALRLASSLTHDSFAFRHPQEMEVQVVAETKAFEKEHARLQEELEPTRLAYEDANRNIKGTRIELRGIGVGLFASDLSIQRLVLILSSSRLSPSGRSFADGGRHQDTQGRDQGLPEAGRRGDQATGGRQQCREGCATGADRR